MTARFSGFRVILEEDVREDDAEAVVTALQMIKGVLKVEPITNSVSGSLAAEVRVRRALAKRLYEFAAEVQHG